jgi:hypothetical protein
LNGGLLMGSNLTQEKLKPLYLPDKGVKLLKIKSSKPDYLLGVKRLNLTRQQHDG